MRYKNRNLKRLVALAATLLLLLAVSLTPGAMALGLVALFAIVLLGTSVTAKSVRGDFSYETGRFGNVALNVRPPGQKMSENKIMMTGCGPPGGRVRKKRFSMSMVFRGDRIRSQPQRFVCGLFAANMRASPRLSELSRMRKILDLGLLHYRARDQDFAANMAAA